MPRLRRHSAASQSVSVVTTPGDGWCAEETAAAHLAVVDTAAGAHGNPRDRGARALYGRRGCGGRHGHGHVPGGGAGGEDRRGGDALDDHGAALDELLAGVERRMGSLEVRPLSTRIWSEAMESSWYGVDS